MELTALAIPGLLLVTPRVFEDTRGFFLESFNARDFHAASGLAPVFVQDNHSRSLRRVLRGLHYQIRQTQGKLVRVVLGEVFDVAVDLRRGAPTFGKWAGVRLSAANRQQIWIPPGFAHGFLVLSECAELLYKTTDYHAPEHERRIAWDDPDIGIAWPLGGEAPLLSAQDQRGVAFRDAECFSAKALS